MSLGFAIGACLLILLCVTFHWIGPLYKDVACHTIERELAWGGSVAVAVDVSDMTQVTGDMQHVTCDTWQMTQDTYHVTQFFLPIFFGIFIFFVLLSAHVVRFPVSRMRDFRDWERIKDAEYVMSASVNQQRFQQKNIWTYGLSPLLI